jgi:Mn2+/Fe2+ NRAMP family transporter
MGETQVSANDLVNAHDLGAVLDTEHVGDITGALGTIYQHDTRPRLTWRHRFVTLLAIIGPGLIVMVGDNDAGAFATYTQAGQNYGASLLWTLTLLIPVLYVCQEMVARLGAVTGVGHARLIFERFGRFWGAFSVIDLFILNGLTIMTEFIGISLAMDYFGFSRLVGVLVAAALIIAAVSTGSFRRFERFAVLLCLGSLVVVPIFVMIHPPIGVVVHNLVTPNIPEGKLSDVMLLIIGIVGTTVAPWQLFFQQSYVVDKRLQPRFMAYERGDRRPEPRPRPDSRAVRPSRYAWRARAAAAAADRVAACAKFRASYGDPGRPGLFRCALKSALPRSRSRRAAFHRPGFPRFPHW